MGETGCLPASFARRRRRGHVLGAEAALERRAEVFSPTRGLEDPGSFEERRPVPHVLPMAAGELGDPLALRVLVEADDCALHQVSVRGRAPIPAPIDLPATMTP
jgi:hypothetical protein